MKENIEEDIKILEELKEEYDYAFGTKIYKPHSLSMEEIKAIKHILSDYKTMKYKLNIISEICVDNSKQHIDDRQSIEEIIRILQE